MLGDTTLSRSLEEPSSLLVRPHHFLSTGLRVGEGEAVRYRGQDVRAQKNLPIIFVSHDVLIKYCLGINSSIKPSTYCVLSLIKTMKMTVWWEVDFPKPFNGYIM